MARHFISPTVYDFFFVLEFAGCYFCLFNLLRAISVSLILWMLFLSSLVLKSCWSPNSQVLAAATDGNMKCQTSYTSHTHTHHSKECQTDSNLFNKYKQYN